MERLKSPYLHIRRMEQKQYDLLSDDTWKQRIEVVEHTKSDAGYRTIYVVTSALEIFQKIKESNLNNGYDCEPDSFIFLHKNTRISANSIDWYYCFSRYSDEQKRLELEKTLNF